MDRLTRRRSTRRSISKCCSQAADASAGGLVPYPIEAVYESTADERLQA
jgi:hypothetical protein